MPISRANLQNELVPGLHALVGLSYKDYGKQWSEIFEQETSKRDFEVEQMLVGFARAAVKPEGESVSFDEGAGEAWSTQYTHITYALAYTITQEAIEDNLYDSLGKRYAKELGRSMAKTKEYVAANVLNLGFSGSQLGGDGQPLFSASHPTYSGQVNSNFAAVGTDLNEATMENAIIAITQWVDERGMIIAVKPRKLVIPTGLQFIAKRILATPYRPGTGDNDINAMKDMDSIPDGYTVNNYLTDADAWFIKTDVADGLKLFQRMPLEKQTEGDFNTGNVKTRARERYSVGFTNPLGIWGSQGAA